jgi:hypothetical protein
VLSEHKHCDNAATNASSENLEAKWRPVLRKYGGKEDKSSTGRVWAAGFHHVTARSRLAGVLKLINRLFS